MFEPFSIKPSTALGKNSKGLPALMALERSPTFPSWTLGEVSSLCRVWIYAANHLEITCSQLMWASRFRCFVEENDNKPVSAWSTCSVVWFEPFPILSVFADNYLKYWSLKKKFCLRIYLPNCVVYDVFSVKTVIWQFEGIPHFQTTRI